MAIALALGCTEFAPASEELPDPMMQTEQALPGTGPDFDCLADEPAPSPLVNRETDAPRMVQSLQITDLVSGAVPDNVSVRACAARDIDCMTPVTATQTLDSDGWVTLPLYEGFDGYIEITADNLVPTLLVYGDPLSVDTQVDMTPLGVVTNSFLPSLTDAAGQTQDPRMGLVHMRVFDCARRPAPGVAFSINQEQAWRWYFVGPLPTPDAQETAESGLGGFINVRPGVAVVDAQLTGADVQITMPKTVYVRAGWFTGIRFIAHAVR